MYNSQIVKSSVEDWLYNKVQEVREIKFNMMTMVLNVATQVAGMMLHYTQRLKNLSQRCVYTQRKTDRFVFLVTIAVTKVLRGNVCGWLCYIGEFFGPLMSQQNCETSWRKTCLFNSCFRTPSFCSDYFTVGYSCN